MTNEQNKWPPGHECIKIGHVPLVHYVQLVWKFSSTERYYPGLFYTLFKNNVQYLAHHIIYLLRIFFKPSDFTEFISSRKYTITKLVNNSCAVSYYLYTSLTVRACGRGTCCDGCIGYSGTLGTLDWLGNRELSTDRRPVAKWIRFVFSRSHTFRIVAALCPPWRSFPLATFWIRSCTPCKNVWASGPVRCWKRPSTCPTLRRCNRYVVLGHRCKCTRWQLYKWKTKIRKIKPYNLYSKAMLAISFLRARYTLSEKPGWFMSNSGSYLVIRWLQLSKSRACLGNHGFLTFMLSSARIVILANVELCLSIFIRINRSFLVMSTLAKTSNWTPCSLDGLDSKWTTLPFPFCKKKKHQKLLVHNVVKLKNYDRFLQWRNDIFIYNIYTHNIRLF